MPAKLSQALAAFVIFTATACALPAAEPHAVRMRWEDISGLISGEKVVLYEESRSLRGRVTAVDPTGISLDRGRRAARAAVQRIRLTRYAGNGRHAGKMIGGLAGLLIGITGAAAIGLQEGSGSDSGKKAAVIALGAGGLPAGMFLGYFLGRKADEEVLLIEIIR